MYQQTLDLVDFFLFTYQRPQAVHLRYISRRSKEKPTKKQGLLTIHCKFFVGCEVHMLLYNNVWEMKGSASR